MLTKKKLKQEIDNIYFKIDAIAEVLETILSYKDRCKVIESKESRLVQDVLREIREW